MRSLRSRKHLPAAAGLFLCLAISCGEEERDDPPPPPAEICNCVPSLPVGQQYRGQAKHVSIPAGQPQAISVATMLEWEVGPEPAPDAPRSGRELQLFRIARAFLQFAWINPTDCDLHLEISDTPEKDADRVIVETPVDPQFCPSRQNLKQQLANFGVPLSTDSGELQQPRLVEVVGLAFQDGSHDRGTQSVNTVWELHPATVTLLPQ